MTTKPRTRDEHLFGEGPKRILALDGGGIRGLLTVQVLKRIESELRARMGDDPDFRLCDYFDLIGGTSTGAIIAAALALGFSVDQIDTLYRELGRSIFKDELFRLGIFRAKFSARPLRAALQREFGDARLGDERIRTGLAIMLKRIDTGSPWIVHNNPRGRYFDERPGRAGLANSQFPLNRVVRASTAAPHYFEPERIAVANGVDGAFVDGGVSPHNNPALQLLMLATFRGYGLRWPLGEDKLLLVSLGTGSWQLELETEEVMRMADAKLALRALSSLMSDASVLNETLLQWLSASATARPIDGEVGDLGGDVLGGGTPWLSYIRYDASIDRGWLREHVGLSLSDAEVERLRKMDDPGNLELLSTTGEATARLVDAAHFPRHFDP